MLKTCVPCHLHRAAGTPDCVWAGGVVGIVDEVILKNRGAEIRVRRKAGVQDKQKYSLVCIPLKIEEGPCISHTDVGVV